LKKKKAPKKIAEAFGIKAQDVYSIYYKKEKEAQQKQKSTPPIRFLVTQEMYDELEKFMEQKKYIPVTLNIIRTHLVQHFGLENRRISLQTVSNMLKRLSFSRKRTKKLIANRNISLTMKKRKEVAIEFLSTLKANKEMIFIDETGFNQTLMPFYGYSKIGETCWIKTIAKTQNFSVIAAITKNKILGFQIFKGSITAEDYGAFIASLLNNNQRILKNPSQYVFFMDNAPIQSKNSGTIFLKFLRLIQCSL